MEILVLSKKKRKKERNGDPGHINTCIMYQKQLAVQISTTISIM